MIKAVVRQNNKQYLRLYNHAKSDNKPWKYPAESDTKGTKYK